MVFQGMKRLKKSVQPQYWILVRVYRYLPTTQGACTAFEPILVDQRQIYLKNKDGKASKEKTRRKSDAVIVEDEPGVGSQQ
jgi:hypothetical protein